LQSDILTKRVSVVESESENKNVGKIRKKGSW
jgi:hypothetical protein